MNHLKRSLILSLIIFSICLLFLISLTWAESEVQWSGTTDDGGDVFFVVSSNNVLDFSIEICLSGGTGGYGCFENILDFPMSISEGNFGYSNFQFELTGTFTNTNTCTGTWSYQDAYMGYGNGTWTASSPASPDIVIYPLNEDFGNQAINTASDAFSFTLTNKGGSNATGSVYLTGNNLDQFEIISGGGNFALSHNQSKEILVVFNPSSTGVKQANLFASGNYPCNDAIAFLAGTGDPPNQKITASDGSSGDFFGKSVNISGDYSVVGAYGDDNHGLNSGTAYIFERTENGLVQRARLTASDNAQSDYFGYSVSISGDYAIIGAPHNEAAYIFEKPGQGWTDMNETTKLIAADSRTGIDFGDSVSISGNHAVVGASRNGPGSAYIFERTMGGWIQRAKLTASDGKSYDYFGCSVGISGDSTVVGARQADGYGESSGSAYIFEKPNGGWTDMTESAKLSATDCSTGKELGYSVGISGNYAIVGTRYNEAAYIFEKPNEGWTDMTETEILLSGDISSNQYFGSSVSVWENSAIVGAYEDSYSAGSAYVFKRVDNGWNKEMKLRASDGASGDNFGISVSINGSVAVVGAHNDYVHGSSTGSAYFYNFIDSPINPITGSPWIPLLLLVE